MRRLAIWRARGWPHCRASLTMVLLTDTFIYIRWVGTDYHFANVNDYDDNDNNFHETIIYSDDTVNDFDGSVNDSDDNVDDSDDKDNYFDDTVNNLMSWGSWVNWGSLGELGELRELSELGELRKLNNHHSRLLWTYCVVTQSSGKKINVRFITHIDWKILQKKSTFRRGINLQ